MESFQSMDFFSYTEYLIPDNYKDVNEFLVSDRDGFIEWVKAGENLNFEELKEIITEEEVNITEEFEKEAVSYYLNDFLLEVKKNREGQAISTGFSNLDKKFLDGGLYPGLYFVGANSSAGKTTFILQMADSIAKSGQGVLIFSLEMSRNELIAKSLSRLSVIKDMEKNKSTKHAKTTRGILKGIYTDIEQVILSQCFQDYSKWGNNIWIVEGVGNVGVEVIKEKTEKYMKYQKSNGKPPVIFIDYLQILAPYDVRMTDKQNVDKNVLELKRLSRDFGVPVVGISSFNRDNYTAPVNMASFKESGAIEYSSDVLIGLQYEGSDYRENEKESERLARMRILNKTMEQAAKEGKSQKMQVKILKNRNGVRGSVYFDFFPKFNFFRPCEEK